MPSCPPCATWHSCFLSLFISSLKFPSNLPNPNKQNSPQPPKTHQMNNAAITTCLLFAFILASFCHTLFYFLAVVLAVLVTVAVARMAMVAWITVLVLLTFVGNRRRVLVRGGRRITADVGSYLIKLLICERNGAFTFACAAVLSLLPWLALSNL